MDSTQLATKQTETIRFLIDSYLKSRIEFETNFDLILLINDIANAETSAEVNKLMRTVKSTRKETLCECCHEKKATQIDGNRKLCLKCSPRNASGKLTTRKI